LLEIIADGVLLCFKVLLFSAYWFDDVYNIFSMLAMAAFVAIIGPPILKP